VEIFQPNDSKEGPKKKMPITVSVVIANTPGMSLFFCLFVCLFVFSFIFSVFDEKNKITYYPILLLLQILQVYLFVYIYFLFFDFYLEFAVFQIVVSLLGRQQELDTIEHQLIALKGSFFAFFFILVFSYIYLFIYFVFHCF
jgi:hypothetical protein